MMNKLILDVTPASDAPDSLGFPPNSLPGLISISVKGEDNEKQEILSIQWDAIELVQWLLRNKEAIFAQELPPFVPHGPSIAESIRKFYSDLTDDQDDLIDMMFDYRKSHEICFGLRGASVPSIYLGLGNEGHEVSVEHPDRFLRFLINLSDFYVELEKKFK